MVDFLQRLKRRKLVQWALAYIVAAFALIQVLDVIASRFDWPVQIERALILALAVGFFIALVIAWYHGEKGRQHVSGPELLLLALVLALGGAVVWHFWRSNAQPTKAATANVAAKTSLALSSALSTQASPASLIPSQAIPAQSVAVLPLLNESGDPRQDYFSDGLSEELISAIAQVHDIKVIGRNSSFRFRGKEQDDTAAIGAKLGVATLLEGTVRKQGNRVRIVASLVKASDGSELWSQTYDRDLKDVFAVQSEIATSVAGALKTTLLDKAIESTDRPPSGNLDAYDAMLQGRFYAERRNRADYLKAVGYYQQAIKLDPGYAMAYARLAIAQQWFNNWAANADERKTTGPLARANATRAVELAPQSAVALGALGINQAWSDVDYPAAEATLKKAVALDPSNPETLYQFADVTGCLGRLDEAVAMMRKVLTMEPLNASFHFYTGQFLLAQGRLDEAEAELRRAIDLQPTAEAYRAYLAMAYIKHGKLDQALESAQAEPAPALHRAVLAMVYFAQGDKARGEAQLAEVIRVDAEYAQILIADIYTLRGDADQAFAWLDRGLAKGDPGVSALYEDPFIVPALRKDPRLAALARKLGLPDPGTLVNAPTAGATPAMQAQPVGGTP